MLEPSYKIGSSAITLSAIFCTAGAIRFKQIRSHQRPQADTLRQSLRRSPPRRARRSGPTKRQGPPK